MSHINTSLEGVGISVPYGEKTQEQALGRKKNLISSTSGLIYLNAGGGRQREREITQTNTIPYCTLEIQFL